jgi:hypothetical protein
MNTNIIVLQTIYVTKVYEKIKDKFLLLGNTAWSCDQLDRCLKEFHFLKGDIQY